MFDFLPIDPRPNPDQPSISDRALTIFAVIAAAVVFASLVYGIVLVVCWVL